jgi:hypothetical protein
VIAFSAIRRGFEEAWKVAALAQLRDAQLDQAAAGLPITFAVTVAVGQLAELPRRIQS